MSRPRNGKCDLNLRNFSFRYGNFERYYGTRLEKTSRDPRLDLFAAEWFRGRSVLDIGCNAGYLTLSIAKEFEPSRVLGIDIDAHLVGVARKNIRHYCDGDVKVSELAARTFLLAHRKISGVFNGRPEFIDVEWISS